MKECRKTKGSYEDRSFTNANEVETLHLTIKVWPIYDQEPHSKFLISNEVF